MKIFVLGATGMLGRYVRKYLSRMYDVVEINRAHCDFSDATLPELEAVFKINGLMPLDTIINCAGTIKPRVDQLGNANAVKINSILPQNISTLSARLGARLIHPTTDCIYSGKVGGYDENSSLDVDDIYGVSKYLGEKINATIIRASIIGEECNQKRSLVEWVKGNAGKEVNGFTNHYWNGVTCLQWAKICDEIIKNDIFWDGVHHVYSNTLSKFELVKTISDIYGLNVTVNPLAAPDFCDRTLSSVLETSKNLNKLNLCEQIQEMKDFSQILHAED